MHNAETVDPGRDSGRDSDSDSDSNSDLPSPSPFPAVPPSGKHKPDLENGGKKCYHQRFSLPPDIYTIESNKKVVTLPESSSDNLFLSEAKSTPTARQLWRIDGCGHIASMKAEGVYAYVSTGATDNAGITQAADAVVWIINVEWNSIKHRYQGYIMVNNIKRNYWGLDGNKVVLQDSKFTWTFTPC